MTSTTMMWVTLGASATALATFAEGFWPVGLAALAVAGYAGYEWYAKRAVGNAVKSALDLGLDDSSDNNTTSDTSTTETTSPGG